MTKEQKQKIYDVWVKACQRKDRSLIIQAWELYQGFGVEDSDFEQKLLIFRDNEYAIAEDALYAEFWDTIQESIEDAQYNTASVIWDMKSIQDDIKNMATMLIQDTKPIVLRAQALRKAFAFDVIK